MEESHQFSLRNILLYIGFGTAIWGAGMQYGSTTTAFEKEDEKITALEERLQLAVVRLLEENQGGRSDQERADDCLDKQQDLKNQILYWKLKYENSNN